MSEGHDISGDWTGIFNYPRDQAPVTFTASLQENGGWITGSVEETSARELGPPRPLGASIQGRRVGAAVTWLKLYDEASPVHDAVSYEGEVSPDGEEIGGRWSIPDSWSGTFLMVRQPGKAAAREKRKSARM
jgi:hypothetical protein